MAGVVLENVSRVYPGRVRAVDGVSLEVFDREFLVLVGPSGCGKTTTLRMIAGLEDPSDGTIRIGSRVVNDLPSRDRGVAMVFQNYALYPHMNVWRNLAFGLELRQRVGGLAWLWHWALPRRQKAALAARRYDIAQRVHQTARVLGIENLLKRLPRQLSGGERQRVALGRAIVRNPVLFLFDEPLSNLDAKLRVEMRRELKQLHQRLNTTMIYVTHDQVEALTLGDRIVVMHEGKIQQIGLPMDVYDWPTNRFVAGFIGTPGMNFIEGRVEYNQTEPVFRRGNWSTPLAERLQARMPHGVSAVLGVRPEDVTVDAKPQDATDAEAVVRLVELLGDSMIITLELNADQQPNVADAPSSIPHKHDTASVMSKMPTRHDLRIEQKVWLRVAPQRVHVFDSETGENWIRQPGMA